MNNPLIYLTRTFWKYSEGNHRNVIIYILLCTCSAVVWALEPLFVGYFLNSIQTLGVSRETLMHLLLILSGFLVIEFIGWALHGPARILELRNAFHVRKNYELFLLSGSLALPLSWHTDHHSGDTIDKINKGTGALYQFSSMTFDIIQGVVGVVTALAALFYFNVSSGVLVFSICVFTFYILTLFDKKLVPGYKKVNDMDNSISAKIFDALSNVTTIIILRVERLVLTSIETFIQKPYKQYDANSKVNELKWFSASMFGRITVFVVITIYLYSNLLTGTILVGTVYILYGYANQISTTFYRFAYLYNDIVKHRVSVGNAEDLSKHFVSNDKAEIKTLPESWREINIQNLSFSYHTSEGADLHLEDISMKIKRNQRIALIGESGGGKSTFLRIMRDLYTPKTLDLSVDNLAPSKNFASISDSISLIPQDPEIFQSTIRENITLGVEYGYDYIQDFIDMAKLTSVIDKLPQKLESSIVEKGVNLSGGEKQRLALARGLVASADKEIILMDEPTSSVDFQNELDIFKNIFEAFKQKTLVVSVHRLHLLSLFDIVYFFDDGKIIASGTFEELKGSSPQFKRLWGKYLETRTE